MARKRKLRSDWNVTALLAGAFVVAFASCFLLNASADYIEDGTKLDLDSKISYSIVVACKFDVFHTGFSAPAFNFFYKAGRKRRYVAVGIGAGRHFRNVDALKIVRQIF